MTTQPNNTQTAAEASNSAIQVIELEQKEASILVMVLNNQLAEALQDPAVADYVQSENDQMNQVYKKITGRDCEVWLKIVEARKQRAQQRQ